MAGWGRYIGRSTSSCSCSSRAPRRTSTTSNSAATAAIDSNLWTYPSQNVLNGTSKSKLALHPTPKPVALVADAIRDCSHRNGIILDPFGGAGSTLIAAERTGRQARLIELEPRFVDAAIKRWQAVTGKPAVNASTGSPFGGETTPTSSEAADALRNGAQ